MKILLLKPSNHFLRYSAWEAKFHLDLQSTTIYKPLNLLVSFKMEERNEDEKRPRSSSSNKENSWKGKMNSDLNISGRKYAEDS